MQLTPLGTLVVNTEDNKMDLYVDLLLSHDSLCKSLSAPIDVTGCKVAVASSSIPKTFDPVTNYVKLEGNFIQPQVDGEKTLLIVPTHDEEHRDTMSWYPNRQYRYLNDTMIQNLCFTLKNEKEQYVDLKEGTMLIVLHFVESTMKV